MSIENSFSTGTPISAPIKVDIFHSQYLIQPTEHLPAEDIRELAAYVDRRLHEMSRKTSRDKFDIAIMVALQIAAQMCEDQKRFQQSIHRMIEELEKAVEAQSALESDEATSAEPDESMSPFG
ncbi:cell division protein ZapA [Candidatus Poribacteria bacterium]|nr:cell division protein ZapA [Candidatus Poribacteria bacterium]